MKRSLSIGLFLFLLPATAAQAQYYFKGEIRDARHTPLPYVSIRLHATNTFYYSGSGGGYGIPSSLSSDSATLTLNGYESVTILLSSAVYQQIEMRLSSITTAGQRRQLLSRTTDPLPDHKRWWGGGGETYMQQVENAYVEAARFSSTSFAMNVDKASYSNIRRFIRNRSLVPPDAVRIEEMLNYFPVPYREPESGQTFFVESQVSDCPWNPAARLLFIRTHARKINFDHLPPNNLVFLVDVSGSMVLPSRLPLLKTAFRMMVQHLRPVDTVSIMVYGGMVGVVLPPTSGSEQQKIMAVIDSLEAGGDTPGESAIRQAYTLAQNTFIKGGNNRVILATDGDFNVGESSEEALMQLIAQKQQTGIYLTCLGVGMGNYKDSRLEVLAKKGNGNFAYLDHISEAEKVLVQELTSTLYSVADDAYMEVHFDTTLVRQYRLVGYDNRRDVLADSSSTIEGGEIGSGHVSTAVFEVVLRNPLPTGTGNFATADLHYLPSGRKERTTEFFTLPMNHLPLPEIRRCYRLSAAVAMFGMLLKKSPHLQQSSWDDLLAFLPSCVAPGQVLQEELVQLALEAKLLYEPPKKRGRLLRLTGKKN
ncbi:MAG TPA: von Willebrand factor type A domain-containing protein [Lacibacter sp.]|nr:von Willebrand factor type A domain-containing protein [Lacibacter sp.]HMO87695.1 von Willebrand factor type A domain-containing protein [Lacibacter sp.]